MSISIQGFSEKNYWKWLVSTAFLVIHYLPAQSQCGAGEELVNIQITTDQYGDEASWGLYNQESFSIIASAGPLTGSTTYNVNVCVQEDSCYFFAIFDDFGDGICCDYGNGSYSVSYGGSVIGSGGQFASGENVFGIGSCVLDSPLVTDNTTNTPEQLVTDVLLGACVSAFNVNYTGAPSAIGSFSNGAALGIEEGILLTTGSTDLAPGPNTVEDAGVELAGPGDSLLQASTGVPNTHDAAILEFDFVSFNDTVTFNYIFASEEYNEFVCHNFNDVFAFFVTGNGYAPNTNIALVPGTALPVSINSINSGSPGIFQGFPNNPANCTSLSNAALYVDNFGGMVTQYDGYTVPLTATMVVVPCDTYHIKIVIADVNDDEFDSGIFLQAKSFSAGEGINITATSSDGTKNIIEGCSDGIFRFSRTDTANVLNPVVINFTLSGNAVEGVDYQAVPHSITIPANQLTVDVNIIAIYDSVVEGTDTIILTYNDICDCTLTKSDTLFILDNQPLDVTIAGNNTSCLGDSTTLVATGSGSLSVPYSYVWSTGDSTATITVSPNTTTTYIVTVTDGCAGQSDTASHTVIAAPGVVANFVSNSPQCANQNSFNFTNTSSYIGVANFFWDLGNGSTATTENVQNRSYPNPGNYDVLLVVEVNGCVDSVVRMITVTDAMYNNLPITICSNDSIFAQGGFQNSPGIYLDIFTLPSGCDSIVTIFLSVTDTSLTSFNTTICSGDSIFAGGAWQTSPGVYTDIFTGSNTCDSTVITTLNVSNQILTALSPVICEGDSFYADGAFQTVGGIYTDTFPTGSACDSIVITDLIVLDTGLTNISISICDGDSIFAGGDWQTSSGVYTDIFTGANTCDSTVITTLSVSNQIQTTLNPVICEGDSVFAANAFQKISGTYRDTFPTVTACDSFVITNLIVLDTSRTELSVAICDGDSVFAGGAWQTSSGVYTDVFTGANGCDSSVISTVTVFNKEFTFFVFSICQGDSFYAGGAYQDTGGIFIDTLKTTNGCDSIVSTNVTVSDTSHTIVNTTICNGDSVFAGGLWQFTSGTYIDIYPTAVGCDSTIITNLNVLIPGFTNFTFEICEGDSVFAAGAYQDTTGTYRDTFIAANGCDSMVTTTLTVLDTILTNMNLVICDGDSVFAEGAWQFGSGVYTDIYTAVHSCDSTVVTTLDVLNRSYTVLNDTICEGGSLLAGGIYQYLSGSYFDTLSAANGCDSIVTTFLTVLDTFLVTLNPSLCAGDSFFAAGAWQFNSGIFIDHYTTLEGCDSTVIVNLTVVDTITLLRNITICQGESEFAGGLQQTVSGIYTDSYTASGGCDSIVTTNLTVADTFLLNQTENICQGDSFFAGGMWQTTTGIYFDFYTSSAGCDSNIITNLTVIPVSLTFRFDTICRGQTYFAGGGLQTTAGVYIDIHNAASGCDSIVTTNLAVLDTFLPVINATICEGDSFFAAGAWQKNPGIYIDSQQSVYGCDSIIRTILTIDTIVHTVIGVEICEGESYVVGGDPQTISGVYTDSFTTLTGCDSIVTTNLIVHDSIHDFIPLTICQGDSVFAEGAWQTTSGIYVDNLTTLNGCDSIVTIELNVIANITTQSDTTICEGERVFAGGAFQTESGVYTDSYSSSGLCDSIHTTILSVIPVNLSDFTTTICSDSAITLSAPEGFNTYLWFPGGDTTPSISVPPGNYQLTVTDTNGCEGNADYVVDISEPIGLFVDPDSARILEGEQVTIITFVTTPSDIIYYWDPLTGLSCADCSAPVASPDEDMIYNVIAEDEFGCFESLIVKIFVDTLELPTFYVPNAFSPNGDANNDVFQVYGSGFASFNIRIFDRWGEKLFESSDPNTGWDGTYRGQRCLPGVYVYYIDVEFINNLRPKNFRIESIKGSITLIR